MANCMKKRPWIDYYVDGFGTWFVVSSQSRGAVRELANQEYGRSHVKEIRPATLSEVSEYLRWKSLNQIPTTP